MKMVFTELTNPALMPGFKVDCFKPGIWIEWLAIEHSNSVVAESAAIRLV
ncbi:hypothetical protein [Mangrovibacterium sp.]